MTNANQNDITYSLIWGTRDFENYNDDYNNEAEAIAAWDADSLLPLADRTISTTGKQAWLNEIEIAMYDDDAYHLDLSSGVNIDVPND